MGDLFPYQTWVDQDGKSYGCLTPRAMCESIKPAPGEGDLIFDKWFETNATIDGESQDYDSILKYNSDGKPEHDPNTDKYGVYPASKDFESWKQLILTWLGEGWSWDTRKDGDTEFFVPIADPKLKDKYGDDLYQVERPPKNRYVYFCGTKKQKKILLNEKLFEIKPYPKGKNKNYDASYKPSIQTTLF